MTATPRLSRQAVDGWPVAASGLPHRACNSLARAHVRTIGELRRWPDRDLMELRSLGRMSLEHIHQFFEVTGRIEKGRVTIRSMRDLLRRFLDPPMLFVIEHRYGLPLSDRDEPMTLQAIGDLIGRTRERIRQVEESAWERMRTRLCMVFAQELCAEFARWLRQRGGTVEAAADDLLRRNEVFTGYHPMSVVRLMADWTGAVSHRPSYVSALPGKELARFEKAILRVLDAAAPPRRPEDLMGDLTRGLPTAPGIDPLKTVTVILRGHPEISGTLDGRFFLATRSAPWVLRSVLADAGRPLHYREATAGYNERVDLRSQKGAGFILGILNRAAGFRRTDRATYAAVS